ncbi:MAG: hypothetical protein ABI626_09150 [Sphingomicrobium sp.]
MSMKMVLTVALVLGIGLLVMIAPTVANSGSAQVGNCYSAQATSTPTLCE